MSNRSLAGSIAAPPFPPDAAWLNTERPLTWPDLRGKAVLLDFWTYCCINCMHVLPDLKRLERKYADALVVVGVHSAKFETEQQTENIRQAVLRYEIEHPVINDKDFTLWQQFGVQGWPTLALVDPLGRVLGQQSGEGNYELFDMLIGRMIDEFDARGQIDRTPLRFKLERTAEPEPLLAFPGKLLADAGAGRLFISDSNHNQIVVTTLEGDVLDVIGSGAAALADGDFATAAFDHPQGLALDGATLYVADTENHTIRRVDLRARTVETIAGTGQQARAANVAGVGRSVALNSPWDLLVHAGVLYVAMAGPHQIWRVDLATLRATPYAGSGREDIIDGPLPRAALAQPSGITTDGQRLFFADSETSSIRAADLPPGDRVTTIVGAGLFEFGDRDGVGAEARLQHPLGVAYHDGLLYVADTYNNKIKRVDPRTREVTNWLGDGQPGAQDGARPRFDEPGGLAIAGGKVYIADTNNHRIRVADLASGLVGTLALTGLARMAPAGARVDDAGALVELPARTVAPGPGAIRVALHPAPGYKLAEGAPALARLQDGGSLATPLGPQQEGLVVPVRFEEGQGRITLDLVAYYCQEADARLCLVERTRLVVPLVVGQGASESDLTLDHTVGDRRG